MKSALAAVAAIVFLASPAVFAQQPARTPPSRGAAAPPVQAGRLVVTVVDQTGAVLPTATVTVEGIEDATRKADRACDGIGSRRCHRRQSPARPLQREGRVPGV